MRLSIHINVRGAYAVALEMAEAVSQVCPQAQPPHDHTHPHCATRIDPDTGCRCHTQHMYPVPPSQLDEWLGGNDHLEIGLGQITSYPVHDSSCTYTTEVNRKSTKE